VPEIVAFSNSILDGSERSALLEEMVIHVVAADIIDRGGRSATAVVVAQVKT
jgi:hypothetical protein